MTHPPYNPNRRRWLALFLISLCLLVLIINLSSCDCNYHLRQAKKKCGASLLSDTTYVHDTTLVKAVQRDTTFFYKQSDTVLVREGRMTIKYFYNTHDSTVYLNGKCDTVYIVKDVPVAINTTTLAPEDRITWKDWILYGALFVVLLVALFRRRG